MLSGKYWLINLKVHSWRGSANEMSSSWGFKGNIRGLLRRCKTSIMPLRQYKQYNQGSNISPLGTPKIDWVLGCPHTAHEPLESNFHFWFTKTNLSIMQLWLTIHYALTKKIAIINNCSSDSNKIFQILDSPGWTKNRSHAEETSSQDSPEPPHGSQEAAGGKRLEIWLFGHGYVMRCFLWLQLLIWSIWIQEIMFVCVFLFLEACFIYLFPLKKNYGNKFDWEI